MHDLENIMRLAIEEAGVSLKEGNSGFGAVIVKGRDVISKAHDTDRTSGDPTRHAEMNAIRSAAADLGGDLAGCVLISTHEPCPMCSAAALWSGISEVAYGYPISEAIQQGRKRIDLPLKELFERAGKPVVVHENILKNECAVLYHEGVRSSIDQLRGADEKTLLKLADKLSRKRLAWFSENCRAFPCKKSEALDHGYQVFLKKLGIAAVRAPVVRRDEGQIVVHSSNFCPTLEACKILELDTRFVCRHLTERPMTDLLHQVHPKLRFSRNYDKLRPYTGYCEEMITIDA